MFFHRILFAVGIVCACVLAYSTTVGVHNYFGERSCYANGGIAYGPIGNPNQGGFYTCFDRDLRPMG